MKAILAVIALAATAGVVYHVISQQNAPVANIEQLWNSWKLQHGRGYSATEETMRKSIFAANYEMIQAHNSDDSQSFKMELNKFADLTGEEFKQKYTGRPKSDESFGDEYCPGNHGCPTLPKVSAKTFDWRTKGAVTPVKNQGDCGSCWAFSTTGNLEGLHFIQKGVLLNFSEQQIVDCSKSCYGCEGCWASVALSYTARQGNVLETLYPYKGVDGNCKIPKNATLYKVNSGFECVTQKNEDQMIAAIVKQPVSIAVEADQGAFQFYSSGIITSGCGDALDHDVLAVGFDLNSNYYIVKNSWGADWGENGYLRIGTGTSQNDGFGVCGILRCAIRAVNN